MREHQYDGHHGRNKTYAVSMKTDSGRQNSNGGLPMRHVDRGLPAHARVDHGEESSEPTEKARRPYHPYPCRPSCTVKQRAREEDAPTWAAGYTICPHPPLHNPNAFPDFTKCTSSPLGKDGIWVDSHKSRFASASGCLAELNAQNSRNANSKRT